MKTKQQLKALLNRKVGLFDYYKKKEQWGNVQREKVKIDLLRWILDLKINPKNKKRKVKLTDDEIDELSKVKAPKQD